MSKYKRDNEEKWKKCSRQICDALFDSLRSSTAKLRFGEFCGGELRAVRRYSRSNMPYLDSLKQLFVLFNWLSPQVFRPVDFIILSLFETCKPFLVTNPKRDLTNCELNYLLCVLLLHLYLLLTNSTEDQILRRLHYLSPQIVESYGESSVYICGKNRGMSGGEASYVAASAATKSRPTVSSPDFVQNHPLESHTPDEDGRGDDQDDNESMTSTSYASSTTSGHDTKRGLGGGGGSETMGDAGSFYIDDDEAEFNLAESGQFMGKFLLRILDLCFGHLERALKFDSASLYASVNMTSSSSAAFQRDALTNSARDLSHIQHLLGNYLLNLVYILHSGNYPKLTSALGHLVESGKTSIQTKTQFESTTTELFNFDAATFAVRLNKIVLFKISKVNPFLATLWQQFLVLCNFQDPEYWLLSLDSSTSSDQKPRTPAQHDLNASNRELVESSSCSSPYNSLTAENTTSSSGHTGSVATPGETNSIASAKMLRSKIRSMSNYKDSSSTSRPTSSLKIGENLSSGKFLDKLIIINSKLISLYIFVKFQFKTC